MATPSVGVLGCGNWRAELWWRQTRTLYTSLDISACQWDRRLEDTSEASVVVQKRGREPECCLAAADSDTPTHDLLIYRNDDVVWEGPLLRVHQHRTFLELHAKDVSWWLAGLVNDRGMWNPRNEDAVFIADWMIRRNVEGPEGQGECPDQPRMLEFMVSKPCGVRPYWAPVWKYREYVLEIVKELAKFGFHWTVAGRSFHMFDMATDATVPQARLVDEDFLGDLELVQSAESMATRAVATTQTAQQQGLSYEVGQHCTPLGRRDALVRLNVQQDATEDEIRQNLRQAALAALGGRYPAPVVIKTGDDGQLAPSAPVTVDMLVPGYRFDIVLDERWCRPVEQGFRLNQLACEWDADAGEKIGASWVPLHRTAQEAS